MNARRIAHLSLRCYVWLRRFRHRRGYGVHSPFAFQLITRVFYEKGTFYAYEELERRFPHKHAPTSLRNDRLLFRLVNDVRPLSLTTYGNHAALTAHYMQAACRCAPLTQLPNGANLPDEKIDFLYVAADVDFRPLCNRALNLMHEQSVMVVADIHRSKAYHQWWKTVEQDARTVLTFDLYELGIVFFNPHYNKQSYVVNY